MTPDELHKYNELFKYCDEEAQECVYQLLCDQNAEIGVLLQIILLGRDNPGVTDEEVFSVLHELAESMITKSPEAALQFQKDIQKELTK